MAFVKFIELLRVLILQNPEIILLTYNVMYGFTRLSICLPATNFLQNPLLYLFLKTNVKALMMSLT